MSEVIQSLNSLLADHQVLYQKLRTFHWNVTGPHFFGLHAKFEELYTAAAETVDQLAERVVALGGRPLGTLQAQLATARLKEADGIPAATAMVAALADDYRALIGAARDLGETASAVDDSATANLAEDMADGYEKTAWMLRAFLQG